MNTNIHTHTLAQQLQLFAVDYIAQYPEQAVPCIQSTFEVHATHETLYLMNPEKLPCLPSSSVVCYVHAFPRRNKGHTREHLLT